MRRFYTWLAWRLPRKLAYWCYIRVASEATVIDYPHRTPDEVNLIEALRAWR